MGPTDSDPSQTCTSVGVMSHPQGVRRWRIAASSETAHFLPSQLYQPRFFYCLIWPDMEYPFSLFFTRVAFFCFCSGVSVFWTKTLEKGGMDGWIFVYRLCGPGP
jgi:hypothetical protein